MDDATARPREWDAGSYHRVSLPHQDWGAQVVSRLALRGDETVLDLGVGTGRVAAQLLERLPQGRVIGVDGSAAMVAEARERLGERATLICADLLELELPQPADAAVSSATFHWIADHEALFARVRAALTPGAPFVAQCGGRGNIATIVAATRAAAAEQPFAPHFAGWAGPWNYAGAEETRERLERAGFAVERCWLNDSPVRTEHPHEFLRTVTLGAHLERLPEALRDPFVAAVAGRLEDPHALDYVRLNWIATAV